MPMISWDKVSGIGKEIFNVFVGRPGLEWAQRSWTVLEKAGLTTYSHQASEYKVYFRFLALAAMFRDFCDVAWDEHSFIEYGQWLDSLDLDPFTLGLLIGSDSGVDINNYSDEYEEHKDTIAEHLIENSRDEVYTALREHFDNNLSKLLHWFWHCRDGGFFEELENTRELINRHRFDEPLDMPLPNVDYDHCDGNQCGCFEPTNNQLAAYQWVSDGCERYRYD